MSGAAVERRPVRHVPLVGDVAAGTDVLAQENIEETMPLPADLTGDGDLFMLRVRGDSMIDAGILDGDFVVAAPSPPPTTATSSWPASPATRPRSRLPMEFDPDEVVIFGEALGWPVVVKTARGGYDGRGVWVIDAAADLEPLLAELGDVELIVEELVDLDLELAVLVARRADGVSVHYPVVESVQVDGICRETIVPARVEPDVANAALDIAHRAADVVGAIGIIAVELFVARGEVTINEVATRPHNSGHWTIEGATTSQFANHLRAVAGLPLGATDLRAGAVVMANILGHPDGRDPAHHIGEALASPDVALHLYGKDPRPGRKLGHVTVLADVVGSARAIAHRAVAELGDPVPDRP
jgi:5-(carboxyamino)imidazole ribonucleotide synthase